MRDANQPLDLLQFAHSAGSDYKVTENGAITSWSTNAAGGAGQMMTFKVFRDGVVVAHDGPRPLTPLGINTFKVAIPVKVGDVIGLNNANASAQTPNACIFPAGEAQVDLVHFFEGNAADGSAVGAALADGTARRVNVSANVLQPPEINIPGRVSLGSITGGGTVGAQGAPLRGSQRGQLRRRRC